MAEVEIYCDCVHWKYGFKEIVAQNIYCWHRSAAPGYTAPRFRFCPWCGKEVEVKKKSLTQPKSA